MILNIAIIEDEENDIISLKESLFSWSSLNMIKLDIKVFRSGEEFFILPLDYHIVFIDICLSTSFTGIDVAKKLRCNNFRQEIIFTTNFKEYILDGYDVHAFQYLLKPIDTQKLFNCLATIYRLYMPAYHTVFFKGQIMKFEYRNIIYVSSSNHYVDLHMKDSSTPYSYKAKFKDLINSFPTNFMRCHRTLLVNMDYVTGIRGKELQLSAGSQLPISLTYLKNIQQAMIKILKA